MLEVTKRVSLTRFGLETRKKWIELG